MHTILLDADACPVKDETYRVAKRYGMRVLVVANCTLWLPSDVKAEMVVVAGRDLNAADDWIAERAGPGDIVVTADIPLAARCLEKNALVLDPKGRPFTHAAIGGQVGMRDLMDDLRKRGEITGGPPPMTAKDRSRFLAKLDEAVNAVRRAHPPPAEEAKG